MLYSSIEYAHIAIGARAARDAMLSVQYTMAADPDADCPFAWLAAAERLALAPPPHACEPMASIGARAIYVDARGDIGRVHADRVPLDGSGCLAGSRLRALVRAHEAGAPAAGYRLSDILLYNVDVAPEHVQQYAEAPAEGGDGFMRALPIRAEGLRVPASVFVFHDINRLYMVYRAGAPASILKSGAARAPHTRRVLFRAPPRRGTRRAGYAASAASERASEAAPAATAAAICSGEARSAPPGGASSAVSSSAT